MELCCEALLVHCLLGKQAGSIILEAKERMECAKYISGRSAWHALSLVGLTDPSFPPDLTEVFPAQAAE